MRRQLTVRFNHPTAIFFGIGYFSFKPTPEQIRRGEKEPGTVERYLDIYLPFLLITFKYKSVDFRRG